MITAVEGKLGSGMSFHVVLPVAQSVRVVSLSMGHDGIEKTFPSVPESLAYIGECVENGHVVLVEVVPS